MSEFTDKIRKLRRVLAQGVLNFYVHRRNLDESYRIDREDRDAIVFSLVLLGEEADSALGLLAAGLVAEFDEANPDPPPAPVH